MEPKPVLEREDVFIPDRFEALAPAHRAAVAQFVSPVVPALERLDARLAEMQTARRGAFAILHGPAGSGKSTFLNTLGQFRAGLETHRIPAGAPVPQFLTALGPSDAPRILIVEGREARGSDAFESVEQALHSVNAFVRSKDGRQTLVVWPTTTPGLTELLSQVALTIGGTALVGDHSGRLGFAGPAHHEFVGIADRTVQALNGGVSLAALGISDHVATELAAGVETIGEYLTALNATLARARARLAGLMPTRRIRMWVVVVSAKDARPSVRAVTRGAGYHVDVERLLAATSANIATEMSRDAVRLGFLSTGLDVRIIGLDGSIAERAVAKYADADLKSALVAEGVSDFGHRLGDLRERLAGTELGRVLAPEALSATPRGLATVRDMTKGRELLKLARHRDGDLNRALARALEDAGLIDWHDSEVALGDSWRVFSDLCVTRAGEQIHLELMWRRQASEADIAGYVLKKLHGYAKAIDWA